MLKILLPSSVSKFICIVIHSINIYALPTMCQTFFQLLAIQRWIEQIDNMELNSNYNV